MAAGRDDLRLGGQHLLVFAIFLALVWFGGLGHRKLIKPDEGRYAEIPREMVASGDWLTPRLNGLKYFEKPPLQYWTTAIAYEAFGLHEWTSRLWTAATGFAGILIVGWTAARLYDRRTGVLSAIVLASSLGYVLLGHFNTLDMGLTFFMTVTLCAFLLARDARRLSSEPEGHCGARVAPSSPARWMMVAWAALALAVLSKGPVAIVLCGGALVVYLGLSRDWSLLRMLHPVRGLAVFAIVAGPWFVAVSKANRDFAHFFFIHEHIERFLTTEHRREGPLWYFVPIVVVGSLPWLTLLPRAVVEGWRERARSGFAPLRLLLAYVVVVFAFFSLSGSKLPSYVLPLFPALAILVARALSGIDRRAFLRHAVCMALLALVIGIAIVFVALDSSESREAVATFRTAAAVCMTIWLVGTLAAAWQIVGRERLTAAIATIGAAAVVAWASLLQSHEILGRGMSSYDIANAMRPHVGADTPIYSVGMFEHTLDFYLQRTVTLVAFRDELDFGLSQEPSQGVASLADFIDRWNADAAPLAIMGEDVFATLQNNKLPMRIVARDGRRVVIGKPSAG